MARTAAAAFINKLGRADLACGGSAESSDRSIPDRRQSLRQKRAYSERYTRRVAPRTRNCSSLGLIYFSRFSRTPLRRVTSFPPPRFGLSFFFKFFYRNFLSWRGIKRDTFSRGSCRVFRARAVFSRSVRRWLGRSELRDVVERAKEKKKFLKVDQYARAQRSAPLHTST